MIHFIISLCLYLSLFLVCLDWTFSETPIIFGHHHHCHLPIKLFFYFFNFEKMSGALGRGLRKMEFILRCSTRLLHDPKEVFSWASTPHVENKEFCLFSVSCLVGFEILWCMDLRQSVFIYMQDWEHRGNSGRVSGMRLFYIYWSGLTFAQGWRFAHRFALFFPSLEENPALELKISSRFTSATKLFFFFLVSLPL